jgi:hypothetical protein
VDLSFSRFDKHRELTVLPPDLAVLMVHVAARQAASPTAVRYARSLLGDVDATLLAPLDGAFNGPVARMLMKWKER